MLSDPHTTFRKSEDETNICQMKEEKVKTGIVSDKSTPNQLRD